MAATAIGRAASKAAIAAFTAMADEMDAAGKLEDEHPDELQDAAEMVLTIMKAAGVFDTFAVPQYNETDKDIVEDAWNALDSWGYCLG